EHGSARTETAREPGAVGGGGVDARAGPRRPAALVAARAGRVAAGAAANVCLARRGRVELPRSSRRAGHLDRHRDEPVVLCPAKAACFAGTVDQEPMNPSPKWNEILAGYADGEFEGRDDLALLKQRVEDWLAQHPEARAELSQLRQLKQLWRETTPPS